MARITTCVFCPLSSVNHDHDECAEKFGRRLHKSAMKWWLKNPEKPLPKRIRSMLEGPKYEAYQKYLARLAHGREIMRKSFMYQNLIEKELQKIGNGKIRNLDTDFQVQVTVRCTLVPRF